MSSFDLIIQHFAGNSRVQVYFTNSINNGIILRRRRGTPAIYPYRLSFSRLVLEGWGRVCGTHRRKRVQPGLKGVRATQRLINNNQLSRILEFLAWNRLRPVHRRCAANLRLSEIYEALSFITLIFLFLLHREWTRSSTPVKAILIPVSFRLFRI